LLRAGKNAAFLPRQQGFKLDWQRVKVLMAVEQDFIMSMKETTVEHFLWCFSNILMIVTKVNNETFYNVPSPGADLTVVPREYQVC
jgi:hypothetical protein